VLGQPERLCQAPETAGAGTNCSAAAQLLTDTGFESGTTSTTDTLAHDFALTVG